MDVNYFPLPDSLCVSHSGLYNSANERNKSPKFPNARRRTPSGGSENEPNHSSRRRCVFSCGLEGVPVSAYANGSVYLCACVYVCMYVCEFICVCVRRGVLRMCVLTQCDITQMSLLRHLQVMCLVCVCACR